MIAPTAVPHIPMHGNLMDSLKPMILTMLMVNGNNTQNSFMSIIWSILALQFVEWLCQNFNTFFRSLITYVNSYISPKIIELKNNTITPVKKSSITIVSDSTSSVSHAIMDLLTSYPDAKSVEFVQNNYAINYSEEIKIDKELFAIFSKNGTSNNTTTSTNNTTTNSGQTPPTQPVQTMDSAPNSSKIEFYSYTLNMEQLREQLDLIVRNYMVKIKNKLGNQIYYFNELQLDVQYSPDASGHRTIDYSKMPPNLHYIMKPFYTNRKFSNLFGDEIAVIKKRVEFFRDNKRWYDDKGIPYTLGILMSGQSGAGKTSTIKCLANELKRHIVNIHLTNSMTKSQLENVFFNEILHVTQNGKTEQFSIPIDKRIYVIEDVDCQCDIVMERTLVDERTKDKQLIMELQSEVERLTKIINTPVGQHGMSGVQSNRPKTGDSPPPVNQKITLSFILNLLDGVLETPGRIVIMSTNWIEKLDHALIRPGRFDITAKFKKCDGPMMIAMFEHYYDCQLTEEYRDKIMGIMPNIVSPAEMSKLLFENFGNIQGAVDGLDVLVELKTPQPVEEELVDLDTPTSQTIDAEVV